MTRPKRTGARRSRGRDETPGSTSSAYPGANPFTLVRERESQLAASIEKLSLRELVRDERGRPRRLLSANAKTTASLDFPIGHTCRPTKVCSAACYGSRAGAPTRWDKSLKLRLRNLSYFRRANTSAAVDRLSAEFRKAKKAWAKRGVTLDFVRINGVGDLFPEMIPVINEFAARNPDVIVWVVTRKFELAAQIAERPKVYLELSLDSSTTKVQRHRAEVLVDTHTRAFLSFLRMAPTDDTAAAAIVFNEKRTEGLPYDPVTGCPVDAGKLSLGNVRGVGGTACSKCRKCFSPSVLERQRVMLGSAALDRKRYLPVFEDSGCQ